MNPQNNQYYYYYYIYVYSNSFYSNRNWTYTSLHDVVFYLNGNPMLRTQYLLFREERQVCIIWTCDPNPRIDISWQSLTVY